MAGGRPTKYNQRYCSELIEHMSLGLSYEVAAYKMGLGKTTLYNWERKYPEFMNAKKKAFQANQAFWEEVGISAMVGNTPGFIPSIYIFNMKNRFNWRDSPKDENQQVEIKISIDKEDTEL